MKTLCQTTSSANSYACGKGLNHSQPKLIVGIFFVIGVIMTIENIIEIGAFPPTISEAKFKLLHNLEKQYFFTLMCEKKNHKLKAKFT